MKTVRVCLLILVLFFAVTLRTSHGRLLVHPVNTVAVVGTRVVLRCSTDKTCSSVQWKLRQKVVYNGTVGVTGRHRVNTTDGSHHQCDLVIDPLEMEDAGLYTCDDERNWLVASPRAAQLLTLESEPVCRTNFDGEFEIAAGFEVIISCLVQLPTGQLTGDRVYFPIVNWTKADGNVTNSTSPGGKFESKLVVIAQPPRLESVTYGVYFGKFVSNYANRDNEAPEYSYMWKSPMAQVREASRKTLTPVANSENNTDSVVSDRHVSGNGGVLSGIRPYCYPLAGVFSALLLIAILAGVILKLRSKTATGPRKIKSMSSYETLNINVTPYASNQAANIGRIPWENYEDLETTLNINAETTALQSSPYEMEAMTQPPVEHLEQDYEELSSDYSNQYLRVIL